MGKINKIITCIASVALLFAGSLFSSGESVSAKEAVQQLYMNSVQQISLEKEEITGYGESCIKFVPSETKQYEFSVTGEYAKDCMVEVRDSTKSLIISGYYEAAGERSAAAATLKKGKFYFVYVMFNKPYLSGMEVTFQISEHNHVIIEDFEAANFRQDGDYSELCAYCEEWESGAYKRFPMIQTVKLSKTSYVYDGKVKTPRIIVKDRTGKTISKKEYTVIRTTGKSVGKYSVKVIFKNHYSGTRKLSYYIRPAGTKLVSVGVKKGKVTVSWKKQKKQTTGYQVQYSTSEKFSAKRTKDCFVNQKNKLVLSGLKKNKTYYFRVRTYKTVKNGQKSYKVYSSWSNGKKIRL